MMIRSAKPILRLIIPAVLLFLVTALSAAAKEGDPMAEGTVFCLPSMLMILSYHPHSRPMWAPEWLWT